MIVLKCWSVVYSKDSWIFYIKTSTCCHAFSGLSWASASKPFTKNACSHGAVCFGPASEALCTDCTLLRKVRPRLGVTPKILGCDVEEPGSRRFKHANTSAPAHGSWFSYQTQNLLTLYQVCKNVSLHKASAGLKAANSSDASKL